MPKRSPRSSGIQRRNADLLGAVVAGWADSGLHPETFWLGYATIAAAAWNPVGTDALGASADFYRLFYGPSSRSMDRIYQLLSTQAQFWSDSWEPMPSKSRKGIWGSSHSIFPARHDAHDETLPLPIVPQALESKADAEWSLANARRLELAAKYRLENDELRALVHEDLLAVEFNHYNLEVLLSIAALCRQNLDLILGIGRMDGMIAAAQKAVSGNDPAQVVAELDEALALARQILHDRDATLTDTVDTWYKSWQPRVLRANGRTFLHDMDDVKDHLPDRTVGMEYLMLREYLLPLGDWVGQLQATRNSFARLHQLPVRDDAFTWNDQRIGSPQP